MNILQEAEQLVSRMTRAEKIRLLKKIANDVDHYSGIESISDVCGGVPRVAHTKIPVWSLVQYRNLGASEADLLRTYPSLNAENLADAWSYYEGNATKIDAQIIENETFWILPDKQCEFMRLLRIIRN